MYKEDLLNRRDRLAYRILLDIYLHNGDTTLPEVSERLAIPASSLQRYLKDITAQIAPWVNEQAVSFSQTGQRLQLELTGQVTIDDMMFTQPAQRAATVLILKYLYQHRLHIKTCQLLVLLHTSEASLYRQIARLNRLLLPFNLRFVNGQLVGELSQLVFFYFNFWRTTGAESPLSPDEDEVVTVLKEAGLTVDANVNQRLQDWLCVVTRSQEGQWASTRLTSSANMRLMNDAPVTSIIRERFQSWSTGAQMLLSLFILLHTEFMMSDNVWQQFNQQETASTKRLARLVKMATRAVQQQDWTNGPSTQTVTSRKMAEVLIVPLLTQGDMQIFDDISFNYFTTHFFKRDDCQVMKQIQASMKHTDSVWANRFVRQHWDYIERRLLPYIDTRPQITHRKITVALALGFSTQVTRFTKRALASTLTGAFDTEIVTYQPTGQYDMVVVNERTQSQVTEHDGTPIEVISELGTSTDYDRIKARLMTQFNEPTSVAGY